VGGKLKCLKAHKNVVTTFKLCLETFRKSKCKGECGRVHFYYISKRLC